MTNKSAYKLAGKAVGNAAASAFLWSIDKGVRLLIISGFIRLFHWAADRPNPKLVDASVNDLALAAIAPVILTIVVWGIFFDKREKV